MSGLRCEWIVIGSSESSGKARWAPLLRGWRSDHEVLHSPPTQPRGATYTVLKVCKFGAPYTLLKKWPEAIEAYGRLAKMWRDADGAIEYVSLQLAQSAHLLAAASRHAE